MKRITLCAWLWLLWFVTGLVAVAVLGLVVAPSVSTGLFGLHVVLVFGVPLVLEEYRIRRSLQRGNAPRAYLLPECGRACSACGHVVWTTDPDRRLCDNCKALRQLQLSGFYSTPKRLCGKCDRLFVPVANEARCARCDGDRRVCEALGIDVIDLEDAGRELAVENEIDDEKETRK